MLYAIKTVIATVVALCLSVTSFIGNTIIPEKVMAEFYVSTMGSDENTGNYDDTDVDYIMDTYKELVKHMGFEDNRGDSRYIVKFHDIPYYTPYDRDNEQDLRC